jgi:hypothetical protein
VIVQGTGYPPQLLVGVTSTPDQPCGRNRRRADGMGDVRGRRAGNRRDARAGRHHRLHRPLLRRTRFTSPTNANAWLDEHPAVSGVVLTKKPTLQLGVDIFGTLLDD